MFGLFPGNFLLTQHGARFYFKQVVKYRTFARYHVDSSFQRGIDSFYGTSMISSEYRQDKKTMEHVVLMENLEQVLEIIEYDGPHRVAAGEHSNARDLNLVCAFALLSRSFRRYEFVLDGHLKHSACNGRGI